jgi:RimJ/RimL family protein N-acetyltransferase
MNYFDQTTERLHFRRLTEKDVHSWIEFFEGNDHLAYLGLDLSKSHELLSREWIFLQFERYDKSGLGNLAIEIKGTNELIGLGGIIPRMLNGKPEYEIAYSLKPRYWRKGYGTEIATHLKSFGLAFLEASRFISIIHPENKASINVARKNGMQMLFNTTYAGANFEVYGVEREHNQHSYD